MGECPGVAPFLEVNVRFRPTEKQTAFISTCCQNVKMMVDDEAVPLVVATFVVTIFAVFAIKKCTHSSGSIPGELRLHNLSYISKN